MQLALELAAATLMVGVTVAVHLGGIAALLKLMQRHRASRAYRQRLLHEGAVIVGAAAGLFILHAVEIWLYAGFYIAVDAIEGLEPALYFSTVSYTTVGYGDIVLDKTWRVVGAIESANGIILLGWSTAFFVAVVGRIRGLEEMGQHSGPSAPDQHVH